MPNLEQGITHGEIAGLIQVNEKVATILANIALNLETAATNQNTILDYLRNNLKNDIVDAIIEYHANVANDIKQGLESYRRVLETDLEAYRDKLDVKLLDIHNITKEIVEIARTTKNDFAEVKADIKKIVENSTTTKNIAVYFLVIVGVASIVIQLLAKFVVH